MAGERKLIVTIVGDDTSLQKALTRSTAATARFGKDADRNLRRGVSTGDAFGPLLARTREMKEQTASLSDSLDATGAAAGRADGSLFGLVGRASLVGLALNTAYQGSQQLQQSLTTTGEEAFTTAGRLKNMTAALLSTDLIGGIKALTAVPKTLEDAGISATFAEQRYEAFRRVAQGVGDISKASAKDLQAFDDAAREAGTSSQALAKQALAVADANRIATATQNALNDALRKTNTLASGLQVALKQRREDLGGPLGPGGVALEQAQAAADKATSGKLFTPLGPTAKNMARAVIAQASGELDELLRLQIIERDRLAKALENSTGNLEQRQALNTQLAAAQAAVIGTQNQITAAADAAAATAKAAKQARIQDHWGGILGSLQLGLSKAELTKTLNDDLARLNDLKAGLQKQVKAGVDVTAAQTQLVSVTGQIAAKQEQIAANAAQAFQQRQFRALGLTGAGGQVIPGIENLQKQLQQLTARSDFGDLGTKLANQVARAGKVLSGAFGKVTAETREAAAGIIDAARDELNKDISKGLLPRHVQLSDAILKAVGLGKDTGVMGRQRFDTRGLKPGAGGTVNSFSGANITVVADDPDAFLRELQKKAARTTATSRGRFPGRSMGLG